MTTVETATLLTVAKFGGMTAAQIHDLLPVMVGPRRARSVLKSLVTARCLERTALGRDRVFSLTPRGRRQIETEQTGYPNSVVVEHEALLRRGVLRAAVWQQLRSLGYSVSCGLDGVQRLQESLLQQASGALRSAILAQLPPLPAFRCSRCGRMDSHPRADHNHNIRRDACSGVMQPMHALPFDVVWAPGVAPFVLQIDHPFQSMASQLAMLPVRAVAYDRENQRAVYQPKLPVLFVSLEGGLRCDTQCPRVRAFFSLCTASPTGTFPFHCTVEPFVPKLTAAPRLQEVFV